MGGAYAGIDVGGTNIKFGLCNSEGKAIIFRKTPSCVDEGPRRLMKRIRQCAEEVISYATENGYQLDHLGIGTPGVVDVNTGKVIGVSPNIPGWKGNNPKRYLESKLDLPVFVDNDVNVMMLAESAFGAAKGCRNVIAVTVGTGIGGSILIDGKVYRGAYGGAGEFGHMTIVKDGRRCNCGRDGCLEAYAAAPYLLELAESMAGNSKGDSPLEAKLREGAGLTVKDVFDAFKHRTDSIAEESVGISADYLACGLASVSAILNPEAVIIGGGVADAGGAQYVRLVAELLRKRGLDSGAGPTRVVKAGLGNRAGFIGAAILGNHI